MLFLANMLYGMELSQCLLYNLSLTVTWGLFAALSSDFSFCFSGGILMSGRPLTSNTIMFYSFTASTCIWSLWLSFTNAPTTVILSITGISKSVFSSLSSVPNSWAKQNKLSGEELEMDSSPSLLASSGSCFSGERASEGCKEGGSNTFCSICDSVLLLFPMAFLGWQSIILLSFFTGLLIMRTYGSLLSWSHLLCCA